MQKTFKTSKTLFKKNKLDDLKTYYNFWIIKTAWDRQKRLKMKQ